MSASPDQATETLLALRKDLKRMTEHVLSGETDVADHLNLIFRSLARIEEAVGEDLQGGETS